MLFWREADWRSSSKLKEVLPPVAIGLFGIVSFFSSTTQTIQNAVS